MFRSKFSSYFLIFTLPLAMICALAVLVSGPAFQENAQLLSKAVTFDLLIIIPSIYFLLINKTKIPKTTVIPVVILGLIVGKYVLPGEYHFYLDLFKKWALPVIEISVLAFVGMKVYKAIQTFKNNKTDEADFYTILKKTCGDILPGPAVIPVATEIAVFYYGFLNWRKKSFKENEFHYHRESGSVPLLFTIIFLIMVETVVLHILLALWNDTVAWILTLLSLYSLLQLFGFTRSIFKRPISIGSEQLFLRYGIMNEAVIDLREIAAVEISSRDIEANSKTAKLAFLGNLESHNLFLHLHRENTLTGLYGSKKKFKTIALHVDDKHRFKEKIDALIS